MIEEDERYPRYREGNHNARNLYRVDYADHEGEHVGVMFDPVDTARVVEALNRR